MDVATSEEMFEAALDAGATDVESSAESHEIRSDTADFNQMRELLEEKFGAGRSSGLRWIPQTTVSLDEESARSLLRMVELLEESDDVQSVHANFEVSGEVMEKLGS